jgi:hypothetical protein
MHDGLEYLLDLNGEEFTLTEGYWIKLDAALTTPTAERPHGIRYCLTLHDKYNNRIFGFDNAHGIKTGKKFKGRIIEYDHIHKNLADKGTPYEFINAQQLLDDFFKKVDEIITRGRIQ